MASRNERGYTSGMNTAISLPDAVFRDAERLARRLQPEPRRDRRVRAAHEQPQMGRGARQRSLAGAELRALQGVRRQRLADRRARPRPPHGAGRPHLEEAAGARVRGAGHRARPVRPAPPAPNVAGRPSAALSATMLRSPTKRRAVDLGGERWPATRPSARGAPRAARAGPARRARSATPRSGPQKGFFPKGGPPVAAASAAA